MPVLGAEMKRVGLQRVGKLLVFKIRTSVFIATLLLAKPFH